MPPLLSQPSPHIPVLLIDSDKDLARKIQTRLFNHFHAALDLALAESLRDGVTYLCTHQVSLILINLTLSDDKGLDAIRALRRAAPDSGVMVYGSAVTEPLTLAAVRAGAHEVLPIADIDSDAFRLAVERAIARSKQPTLETRLPVTPELAHDLNNALTAINGFAEILIDRLHVGTPDRSCAEQIRNAGARAAELMKTLAPPPTTPPFMLGTAGIYTTRAA